MGIFDKLFGKQKNEYQKEAQIVNDSASVGMPMQSTIDDAKLTYKGQTKYSLNSARCKDGKVFCCQPYSEDSLIGYYERDSTGTTWVWDSYRRARIGILDDDGCIGLSIQELYSNERRKCDEAGIPRPRFPLKTYLHAARWHHGFIFDMENDGLVATYEGDGLAAAAAFVCMVYEIISDTKYNQFFYSWQ